MNCRIYLISVPVRPSHCKWPGALCSHFSQHSSLVFVETHCSSVWSTPFLLKTREFIIKKRKIYLSSLNHINIKTHANKMMYSYYISPNYIHRVETEISHWNLNVETFPLSFERLLYFPDKRQLLMMRRILTCHVTCDLEGSNRATAIWVYPVGPGALSLVLILFTWLLIHCCKETQLSRNLQCAYQYACVLLSQGYHEVIKCLLFCYSNIDKNKRPHNLEDLLWPRVPITNVCSLICM